MTKKNNSKEAKPGDKSRASKYKQQSAPVASIVSVPEKAKKPKGVAAETGISLASSTPAEVGKGTSVSNVAEEEQKMPARPKCAAVPREVIGAGAVPAEVKAVAPLVKAIEAQGVAEEKLEEAEDENKDDDDDDDDSGGSNDEEESGNEESAYNPDSSAGDGPVKENLADDVDNLPDEVKPSQKEKVSSPFDLPILPIAKTMKVKKGKKGKKGNTIPDGDNDSILMLTKDDAKSASPSKQKKKVLATKSPPPGSASKVGTSASSEEALMMIKGCQELFFNLPWKNYVSVFGPFTFLFS